MKEYLQKMPKGTYLVGDLCYVIRDDELWSKVCDISFQEDFDGLLNKEIPELPIAWLHGTHFGDGEFDDNYGRLYGVDSGTIGLIKVDDEKFKALAEQKKLKEEYNNDIWCGCHTIEFEEDFVVYYEENRNKTLGCFYFGNIVIAS